MVTVTATDSYGASATTVVTVMVTNVDEVPELMGPAAADFAENGMGAVASYSAEDPEGESIVWSLAGDDAGEFSIDGGILMFKSPPDFETPTGGTGNNSNIYTVTVQAGDGGTTPDAQEVRVTVTDVEEPGTVTLTTLQPQAGIMITATLEDPDEGISGTEWQWSSSSSMSSGFADIDDATSAMYTVKDGDATKYLRAIATYTDAEGSDKTAMMVSMYAARVTRSSNDAPEFPDQDPDTEGDQTEQTRTVKENTPAGQPVGDPVTATDDDGDNLTYTLGGTDDESFSINRTNGQIMTKAPIDFEDTQNTEYTVTVRATDPFGQPNAGSVVDTNAAEITVTITVENVDEDPMITAGPESIEYAEPIGDSPNLVASNTAYTATDPEDNDAPDLSTSGADGSKFEINTNEQLMFKAAPDFEAMGDADGNNVYELSVVATDSKGNTDMRSVTVKVTNTDEPGTVTLSTVQPRVGVPLTATLTDPDGDISGVTWQWERGTTPIDDATSATYTPVTADDTQNLIATAMYTDGQGGSKTAEFESANEVMEDTRNKPPYFPDTDPDTEGMQDEGRERTVPENSAASVEVGTGAPVEAMDPNSGANDNLTYSLGGDDANLFSINSGTGQITVGQGTKLDTETQATYMVTVTATDSYGETATTMVTIKVTNVDEPPVIMIGGLGIGGPSNVNHAENDTSMVAAYTAAGPDAAMASFTLSGDDSEAFTIGGSSGELMFASPPDYENQTDMDEDNIYMVTVMANDGTNDAMLMVTVTVTNVDELGTLMGDASVDYMENGTDAVMTYTADGPVDASWSVGGDDMGAFTIGASSGELMFVSSPDFENSTAMGMDNMYMVTVMAAAGGEMGTMDVTVNVTNEEEPGTVALSNPSPLVDDVVMADLTDPDGSVTEMTWQWSRTMDMADGWADIMGADMASYTATSDDDGHYLQATASYTDGEGADKSAAGMTANPVTAVADQDGTVSLSATEPQVGGEVTASLTDPDGSVTGMTWQWAKSMDGMTGWADISTATDAAYTPVEADDGYYLRATVSYTDGHGTGKSAMMVTDNAVTTGDPLVNRYDADNNGTIDKSEVIQAINDYLFDEGEEPITKTDVIRLINLYLGF